MGKTNGFLSFANTFPTEQSCIEYYEQIRWNGKVVSRMMKLPKSISVRMANIAALIRVDTLM